jgi:4-amino-4-deoxy-L-arabinose transferase-like glycosyltransferase
MQKKTTATPAAWLILLVILAVMLLPWLGQTLFSSKGEPREAIVAVSILQSGNWILPVNYGGDIPFKPPFLAWLISGLALLFNGGVVNEYLSRLPSAIAMIAMVMTGYFWAKRIRGERFAMTFALVTATASEVFRSAIVCRLDMVLTACIVCSLYIMYNLREYPGKNRRLRYAAVVALLTCATMTKGPVGALLPCLIMGIYCLLRRDRFFPTLGRLTLLCLASLIVPAIWAYLAWQQGGQHFLDLFLEENIGRLTGSMSYDSHIKPWWYNFETLAIGLAPWTLLMLLALCFDAREMKRRALKPAGLFALTAAVIVVGFYCIPASKRSVYLLPAYPFICYGIASAVEAIASKRSLKVHTWILAAIAVIVPCAIAALSIFVPEKLPVDDMPGLGYIFLAMPLLVAVCWAFTRRDARTYTLTLTVMLFTDYVSALQPIAFNPLSDKKLLPTLRDSQAIYSIATSEGERFYTLNYYLGDVIRTTPDMASVADRPDGTIVLINGQIAPSDSIVAASSGYHIEQLTDRGCDFRSPIFIARKHAN